MARILVLGVKVPFSSGGQEVLVGSLIKELKARGHEADLVELPFQAPPKDNLLKQAALWRAVDFESFGGQPVDLVIATKYPSFYARHPRKSLWLVHQHRPVYELFSGPFSDFSDNPDDEAIRRAVHEADTKAIAECSFVSGISGNVVQRLEQFNGLKGEVLYPPLPQGGRYRSEEAGDYVLSVGRICGIKRVDLLIKCFSKVNAPLKLRIVGAPDERGIMDYLNSELNAHSLHSRVEFLGRVSDEELVDLYARAFAVAYIPYNEDYGYVTLEAMASGRPLITTNDSGGVLEFARDGENGLILEPRPDAISAGINSLLADRERAAAMGQAGRQFIESEGLMEQGWEKVIKGLLSPLENKCESHA